VAFFADEGLDRAAALSFNARGRIHSKVTTHAALPGSLPGFTIWPFSAMIVHWFRLLCGATEISIALAARFLPPQRVEHVRLD
jgi:hypothetical protein